MRPARIFVVTLLSLGLVSAFTTQSWAQTQTDQGAGTNTGTGTTTGSSTGGTAINASEIGMSSDEAFTIDRGDTIGGGSSSSGFGIGSEASGNGSTGGARGGGGAFGGLGGLGGLGNLFGGGFGQQQQSSRPIIRTRLRSAIKVDPIPAAEVQRSARRTFGQLPPQQGVSNVSVQMDGRTAILSGNVTSERDRRMALLLMSLEPGVSKVQNKINVQP